METPEDIKELKGQEADNEITSDSVRAEIDSYCNSIEDKNSEEFKKGLKELQNKLIRVVDLEDSTMHGFSKNTINEKKGMSESKKENPQE